jgi:hypothetical protein
MIRASLKEKSSSFHRPTTFVVTVQAKKHALRDALWLTNYAYFHLWKRRIHAKPYVMRYKALGRKGRQQAEAIKNVTVDSAHLITWKVTVQPCTGTGSCGGSETRQHQACFPRGPYATIY